MIKAYQQETEWSCSAATLKAALLHLGEDFPETELVKAIGAKKGRGAETTDIMNGAKKLGFDAYEGSFSSLEAAKKTLKKGIPIIADVQSFNYPGKGHYIVIAGFKPGKGFIIMDPNTKGKTAINNWRVLSEEELEKIWWDRAMASPHELMPKWGVMVKPKTKDKTANGDMLAYFRDNPKKLKEYQARQAAKKKGKRRVIPWGRKMTAKERFVASRSPGKAKTAEELAKGFADQLRSAAEKVANDPIKEKLTLHGIPLALEWRKGEVRKYFNHDPLRKKSTGTVDYNKKMKADYGYVRGVMDADGEELDVYIGPNRDSEHVYVLEKLRESDGSFDENKIMLGYDSMDEAKKSYLQHQGKDEMGKVRELTLKQFDKEFLSKKEKKASGDSNEFMRRAAKKKVAIFAGGSSSGYGDGAPTPPDPSGGKTASGDLLGRRAMHRAKSESASAHPSFGKFARDAFLDETEKIALSGALGAMSAGAKAGGVIKGVLEAADDEPDRFSRTIKGIGAGALIGALITLGLRRNAIGKTTLPRF